jgi:hypothetical protein
MGDSNLIVDVSKINNLISNVDRIGAETKTARYYIANVWCTPLHIDTGTKPLKMEANVISSTSFSGFKSTKLTYTYHFKNSFTSTPVVVATYDGPTPGVTVRIQHISGGTSGAKGKDSVTFLLQAPSGTPWQKGRDKFYLHFIATGH